MGSSGARSNGRTDAPGVRGAYRNNNDYDHGALNGSSPGGNGRSDGGSHDLRDRLDIKARLGAITGVGPAAGAAIAGGGPGMAGPAIGRTSRAAGRGTRARAGLRPGQAYPEARNAAAWDVDSVDLAGFRGATAQARPAALKDRAGTGRRAGTAAAPGRRVRRPLRGGRRLRRPGRRAGPAP